MRRVLPWLTAIVLSCEGATPASGPEPRATGEPAIVAPAALQAAIAAGVRRLGENEARFEVDAFVAALAIEELAAGGGGIRVEPAIEGGAMAGYRIAEVVPGSPYALLGLRAGDVIEAIGDVALDSPERAAGLVGALGRGGTLSVVRDGVGFTMEVRVAGGVSWAELLRRRAGTPGVAVPDRVTEPGAIAQVSGDLAQEQGALRQVFETIPVAEVGAAVRPGTAEGPRPQAGTSGGAKAPSGASGGKPASAAGGTGGTKAPGGSTGGTGSAGGTGVQCASATSCTLDRKVFDAAVADPSKLERQASIARVKNGYKLTRVAPGSTVAALGFRAGDVIVSVNGARLDDDMAALGLYMGLGSTKSYAVVYERGGARASKSIALR